MTKKELEAALALASEALAKTQGPEAQATPEPVKRELAALHVVPDTKFGILPEPRSSGNHYVSVVSVSADGNVVMSSNTGAPRKPARIPLAVAEHMLTPEGQAALAEQVACLK
jgi:hypothetical protein